MKRVSLTSVFADKFGDNEKYSEYVFERILKPYEREALAVTLRQLLDE